MNKTKLLYVILLVIVCSLAGYGQKTSGQNESKEYDSALAQKLGADDYGMKTYVFVILKTGKAKIEDKEEVNKLQAGHMKNIGRLEEEGKLVLAGPFIKGGDFRGIYVFDVKTIEEAEKMVETDPAIKAGLFDVELRLWYGSAALSEILQIHKKVQKKEIME